jgi:hypothetical protein
MIMFCTPYAINDQTLSSRARSIPGPGPAGHARARLPGGGRHTRPLASLHGVNQCGFGARTAAAWMLRG